LIFPDADLRREAVAKVEYARERVLGLIQEIEDASEQGGTRHASMEPGTQEHPA
jgi:hypothetical protein